MLLLLYRAAQKLNLSSKRKKCHPPLPHTHDFSIYATNFSGILQLCPPPAPPCLLRAVSKIKDNPGIGKVTLDFNILKYFSRQILTRLEASGLEQSWIDSRKGSWDRESHVILNVPECCHLLWTLQRVRDKISFDIQTHWSKPSAHTGFCCGKRSLCGASRTQALVLSLC